MKLLNQKFKFPSYLWVSSAYFAEGLPAAMAGTLCIVIFSDYGISNDKIAFWTSITALPWSLKFLWAPLMDSIGSNRLWMLLMQFAMAAVFAVTGLIFGVAPGFALLIALFFLAAILSATHDIAADGYYMKALTPHDQAVNSGLRNIFYKGATLVGTAGFGALAGAFKTNKNLGWAAAFLCAAVLMFLIFLWHCISTPPELPQEVPVQKGSEQKTGFFESFLAFFKIKGAYCGILFLLFYRIAESQLAKISVPFLMADSSKGGLGMSVEQVSMISSGAGAICFLIGGTLAGIAVGKWGFGKCLIWMAVALNVPDVIYLILSFHPGLYEHGFSVMAFIGACMIALEQFGYGLGYMAHVLFMVQFANRSGRFKATHFALMTGITILGMTLFGMFSGKIQMWLSSTCAESASYTPFFVWICLFTLPSFAVVFLIKNKIDPDFGKKQVQKHL